MFDVGLTGLLGTYVAGIAWRALWGAPPTRPIRFAVAVAVSMVIHLGFHAVATAAPSVASAAALVLAGWSTFALWCMWLGRVPSGFREGEDEEGGGEDGGGGGRGPGDGPDDRDRPPGDDDGPDVDWDRFEQEFAAYVRRARDPEPAAD